MALIVRSAPKGPAVAKASRAFWSDAQLKVEKTHALLSDPSPEMSMVCRVESKSLLPNRPALKLMAAVMPVPPDDGRPAAAMAAAKALADTAKSISVQPTDCACPSDQYTKLTAIFPKAPAAMAFCTAALWNAATQPSR